MELTTRRTTIFLLSPAYCGGRRATYLLRQGSRLAIAARLAQGTLTLGEAFTFMSGLYFRGKTAYAMAFGGRVRGAFVITPTRGLLPLETPVTAELIHEFAAVDVDADDARYRRPLVRSVSALARAVPPETRFVLLGSIATGKYVDVLTSCLGERLHFPVDFVGRGDMSRGGLMLRSAASGVELAYEVLGRTTRRRGVRPPRLAPLSA